LDKIEAEKAEREKMFAKMRAEQERIMDNRGEEDARRARKHQEQRILAERKALAEKEARRKQLYEYVSSRCALDDNKVWSVVASACSCSLT